MCAARNNRSDVVDFLLDTLEDIKVDAVDLELQTALFHAALGGHAGIVQRLAEAGAKTDVRNKVPLHTVAQFRFPQASKRSLLCWNFWICKICFQDVKRSL
jgi:ankyrin repeat protein